MIVCNYLFFSFLNCVNKNNREFILFQSAVMDILVLFVSYSVVTQTLENAVNMNVTVNRFIATLPMVVKVHLSFYLTYGIFKKIDYIIPKMK